ncbi:MAG: DLW-39 family protein [Actinobacteria bacterium]|nr:DLW-39 family protein [Actinomycetota bacterium]
MKKLLIVAALAGIGYVIYRQVTASKAEQDLWSEATTEPDLR